MDQLASMLQSHGNHCTKSDQKVTDVITGGPGDGPLQSGTDAAS